MALTRFAGGPARSIEFSPHCRCAAGSHCRINNYEHVTSESAVACPESHNDPLVFSRKEVISRVPDQNGLSLLYIMLEIHHSGRELSCLL